MSTKPIFPTNTKGWPEEAVDYVNAAKDYIEQLEAGLEQLQLNLDESEELRHGTYFSKIQDIGGVLFKKYNEAWYTNIKRTEEFPRFQVAINAAKNWKDEEIATASGRSAYSGTSLTVSGMDAASMKRHTKKLKSTHIDGEQRQAGEVAHMLAFSSKCSSFCAEFVQGAAGVDFSKDDNKEKKIQALVHGVMDVDGTRRKGTGMKHYRDNMARILHQGKYCDQQAAVLFLPILSLDDVKKPPMEYDVMVICDSPRVYQELVLTERATTCAPDEIKMAVSRLDEFLQAAGFYLASRKEEDFDVLVGQEKKHLKTTWEKITGVKGGLREKQVPTLKLLDDDEWKDAKVLKVKFSNSENQLHSYVDPWLLLMKNAIMFSAMADFKLLPGCEFEASQAEDSASEDEDGFVPEIPETISFAVGGASDKNLLSMFDERM